MIDPSVRPADAVERVVETYGDMLYRLCIVMLGNESDAEDVIQETMIRYFQKAPIFRDKEHEKAWLIKVATNRCRDMLRFKSRHPQSDIDELFDLSDLTENDGTASYSSYCDYSSHVQGGEGSYEEVSDHSILEALMDMPEKFRMVLVLHYVEGYSTEEIAQIIGRSRSAVKMRLQKGRRLLEEKYRKEYL